MASEATAPSHPVADLVLVGGRITTLDPKRPSASAVAIAGGRFVAVGDARDVQPWIGASTRTIDVAGRRVIPGLNDSHTHVNRGGLTYNAELRWEGVTSQSARRTVARRLADKGADGAQVGELLGLSSSRAVRRLLSHERRPLETLAREIV